jgi:hypothetical protein
MPELMALREEARYYEGGASRLIRMGSYDSNNLPHHKGRQLV